MSKLGNPFAKLKVDTNLLRETAKEQTSVQERTSERTDRQTEQRTNEQRNEERNERTKIRHSFDIFADQLLSLKQIAIERERIRKKRVRIGDLVQEALEKFIHQERPNETTNERTG